MSDGEGCGTGWGAGWGGVSQFPFAANVDRKREVPLSEKVSRGDGGGGTIGGGREADSIFRSHTPPDAVSSLLCTREAVWTGEGGGAGCQTAMRGSASEKVGAGRSGCSRRRLRSTGAVARHVSRSGASFNVRLASLQAPKLLYLSIFLCQTTASATTTASRPTTKK